MSECNIVPSKIQLTVFENAGRQPLAKTLAWQDGKLVKRAAAQMTAGMFRTVQFNDIDEFADALDAWQGNPHMALSFGVCRTAAAGGVTTRERPASGCVARTRDHFEWPAGPGVLFLDVDPPPGAAWTVQECDAAICYAMPELAAVRRLWAPSGSASIFRDGQSVGSNGLHCFIPVSDARKIPDVGNRLFAALVDGGHGRVDLNAAGHRLLRTIIDATVWQPERLAFVFGPVLEDGLDRRHWQVR